MTELRKGIEGCTCGTWYTHETHIPPHLPDCKYCDEKCYGTQAERDARYVEIFGNEEVSETLMSPDVAALGTHIINGTVGPKSLAVLKSIYAYGEQAAIEERKSIVAYLLHRGQYALAKAIKDGKHYE